MKYRFTRNISVILLLLTTTLTAAPGGSVTGYAYDKANRESLIGANVFIANTRYGSTTNGNGYFSIPGVPVGEYMLVCRYMGYTAQEEKIKITVGDNSTVNFLLKPETLETEAVVVTADSLRTSERLFQQSISEIKMDPRHIKAMPQIAESDLMRSLQTLPGILPISDYSSELYVRGGMPSENLYQIDGADVYNPEHFFGLFSTFNTDAIKNVDISKGGFGAEYGGRLSSVLNVTNLDGNRESFSGDVSISLLSAKTTLQVPMGNWGSISGSIRRTYFDKTYSKFIDDIPDYYFYDGHLKAFIDISDRNKLTLSTYQGQDDLNFELDADDPNSEVMKYKWGNRTLSARWTHIFSPQLFSNFWITQSFFSSDFDFELLREKNEITDLTFKGNLQYYCTNDLDIQFGYEIKNLNGFLKEEFPGGTVDASQTARHYAGYTQLSWSPNPLWNINAGLRYNAFDSDKLYTDW
ncbi:carboxypeptidase-like regulatory domain-containing protein, partial [bacterium]|nr:carboxypeptidase-like regulatory domain-containing protein [bacterium]